MESVVPCHRRYLFDSARSTFFDDVIYCHYPVYAWLTSNYSGVPQLCFVFMFLFVLVPGFCIFPLSPRIFFFLRPPLSLCSVLRSHNLVSSLRFFMRC